MKGSISQVRIFPHGASAFRDFEGKPTLVYSPSGPVRLGGLKSEAGPAVGIGVNFKDGYGAFVVLSLSDFLEAGKIFAEEFGVKR